MYYITLSIVTHETFKHIQMVITELSAVSVSECNAIFSILLLLYKFKVG